MLNPKTEALQLVKGWVRMPDGTKVRYREGGGDHRRTDGIGRLTAFNCQSPIRVSKVDAALRQAILIAARCAGSG